MIAPCGIEVKVGQVWEEVDPRHPIRKKVVGFTTKSREVWPGYWVDVPAVELASETGRKTTAQLLRFHRKRGGYRLVKEAE